MVSNLQFAYAEGVRKNPDLELSTRIASDMWLRPLEKEIDEKNITVHVLIQQNGQPLLYLQNADAGLRFRFMEQMRKFDYYAA